MSLSVPIRASPNSAFEKVTILEVDLSKAPDFLADLEKFNVKRFSMVIIGASWEMGNKFKDAIEISGWKWLYHGSKFKGHLHVPEDYKGAVVLHENFDSASRKLGVTFDTLGIKYNFVKKTTSAPVWIHPICKAQIFEYADVPFSMVLGWKKDNLTPQELSPVQREYSNPAAGTYMTTERPVRMATRVEPSDSDKLYSATLERALQQEAANAKLQEEIAALKAAAAAKNGAGTSAATDAPAPLLPAPGKRARSS